ncbi:hypothetical protein D3C76_1873150 [compost metagenome]
MTQTNLAWTGIADFDILVAKDFGTTGFVEAYGLGHFSYSPVCNIGCCVDLR